MCITGLVCAIDTVFGLVDKLLRPGHMDYILMYKFSQDHLELFFNAIRRCGMYDLVVSLFVWLRYVLVIETLVVETWCKTEILFYAIIYKE